MQQKETTHIAVPFCNFLKVMGWTVENIHGNQYQEGLPDKYIFHDKYSPRWVEFKVFSPSGSVELTAAQKRKFPVMAAKGVPIYVIAHTDLRGDQDSLMRLYKKLFEEPNVHYAMIKSLNHMLR
jgi:hypothetical protein